ncbi:MAG: tetratricopeptide repeat protein [Roseimicrobium sp.]
MECLIYAERQKEAIALLEGMRADSSVPTFQILPSLGYALFADKQFAASREAFEQVVGDSAFTAKSRLEAEKMLGKVAFATVAHEGLTAMNRRDFTTAQQVLERLEQDFAQEPEVLGYRAALLARTERSEEALKLLDEAKRNAADSGKPFTQQDVLADVFLVRKEFAIARAAYQEILDGKGYDLSMRLTARRGLRAVDREELVYRGYEDLSWGRTAKARAKEVEASGLASPEDKAAPIYAADILLAENKPEDARAKFEEIRAAAFVDQPFPGMNGLAASQVRLGEWDKAYEDYREVATEPGYLPQEKLEAAPRMRALAELTRPGVFLDGRILSEATGDAARLQAVWQTAWHGGTRAIVRAREDWLDLRAGSPVGARSLERAEAELAVQHRIGRRYFAEVTLGGSQEGDFLYGAKAGRYANDGIGWSIGWSGNARGSSGLALEALNGRENRVDVQVGGKINPRTNFSLEGFWQQVSVDGQSLGSGFGLSGHCDIIVQLETATRPEISLGWFGSFTRFQHGSSAGALVDALAASDRLAPTVVTMDANLLLDALVDPETHRQGFQVALRKRFGDDFALYATVGSYYELEDASLNFTGAAGLEWYVGNSALIFAELRYDSSGRGASAAQGVWEASMGSKVTF